MIFTLMNILVKCIFSHFGFGWILKRIGIHIVRPPKIANTAPIDRT